MLVNKKVVSIPARPIQIEAVTWHNVQCIQIISLHNNCIQLHYLYQQLLLCVIQYVTLKRTLVFFSAVILEKPSSKYCFAIDKPFISLVQGLLPVTQTVMIKGLYYIKNCLSFLGQLQEHNQTVTFSSFGKETGLSIHLLVKFLFLTARKLTFLPEQDFKMLNRFVESDW